MHACVTSSRLPLRVKKEKFKKGEHLKSGISLSREAESVEDESPLSKEEEEEETEEAEDKEWETEEDEKMPLISGSSVPLSESGSGDFEGSADASVGAGDIGSGDSWTEGKEKKGVFLFYFCGSGVIWCERLCLLSADLAVVGESRPSESQARLAEPELHEDHLLST